MSCISGWDLAEILVGKKVRRPVSTCPIEMYLLVKC
jgi:hypothetical protein